MLGANSYYPREEEEAENGKMDFSQPECGTGFSVPGAFKLDHLHPVKPILLPKFSNIFLLSYWGSILITLGRGRLKMGKWISPNLSAAPVFQCLGQSHRTICTLLSRFCYPNFQTFSLLWANSYYPREGEAENGKIDFSQPECGTGFLCIGHSNWTICTLLSQFCYPHFQTFSLLYWGPIHITPGRGRLKMGKLISPNLSAAPVFCA